MGRDNAIFRYFPSPFWQIQSIPYVGAAGVPNGSIRRPFAPPPDAALEFGSRKPFASYL